MPAGPASQYRGLLSHGAAVLALTAAACAHQPEPNAKARPAIEAVIQAEADFANAADQIGIVPAFRQYVGPNATCSCPIPLWSIHGSKARTGQAT
jgi:hypothetical protein